MIGPSWLADMFGLVVIAVALFSAARLIASRRRRRRLGQVDADGVHVVMGVAMAGMFVPRLATFPNPAWEIVFAAGALWFGWRAIQVRRAGAGHGGQGGGGGAADLPGSLRYSQNCCPYPVPHLIDCVAMLYALWAVSAIRSASGPAAGLSGMAGGTRLPALGLALALAVCGYVVWLGDRMQLLAPVEASAVARTIAASLPGRSLLAPRAATCCKIAMGVAMGLMLVDLL